MIYCMMIMSEILEKKVLKTSKISLTVQHCASISTTAEVMFQFNKIQEG